MSRQKRDVLATVLLLMACAAFSLLASTTPADAEPGTEGLQSLRSIFSAAQEQDGLIDQYEERWAHMGAFNESSLRPSQSDRHGAAVQPEANPSDLWWNVLPWTYVIEDPLAHLEALYVAEEPVVSLTFWIADTLKLPPQA